MDINLTGPHKDFEKIKKTHENGQEYWTARELMRLLDYPHWQKAEEVIGRAARACANSGQDVDNHFTSTVKMVNIGSNTVREVRDYKLDRYACYLIAQNGDPNKPQIALAQSYFAIQTRKQELANQAILSNDRKRLYIRSKVTEENKKLASTAKRAGVTKFGSFNDAGYLGLYGMKVRDIEEYKQLQKGELLNRAGSEELAANLFRITQTEAKIRKEDIQGQDLASKTHYHVGDKVRRTILEIGGTLPEQLLTEKHIKVLKKKLNILGNGKK